jgi:class 3 adenylate cyclase
MRRPKLATKITLLIVAVMIVGFGASTLWSLRREEALLVDQNKMAARRLTATLVASIEAAMLQERPDVTRTVLQELEPKRLNQLVQTYFSSYLELIHDHHGDVSATADDGLMVIFQAERSSGDHALNATRAAFAIRQRTRALNEEYGGVFPSISLHMGINTGEALVGATKMAGAGAQRWTFTATGSTTNVAARLGAFAGANEIVVGSVTSERIKQHFVLEALGDKSFKNVSQAIAVYRVIPPGLYEKIV